MGEIFSITSFPLSLNNTIPTFPNPSCPSSSFLSFPSHFFFFFCRNSVQEKVREQVLSFDRCEGVGVVQKARRSGSFLENFFFFFSFCLFFLVFVCCFYSVSLLFVSFDLLLFSLFFLG